MKKLKADKKMILKEVNLKIYEISNYEEFAQQKTLLPNELFLENLRPGDFVKLYQQVQIGHDEEQHFYFVSQIYPMRNEYQTNTCFIDQNCFVNNKKSTGAMEMESSIKILDSIEVLPNIPYKEVSTIFIDITLNENIFNSSTTNKKIFLEKLNCFLQNYYLLNNINIKTNNDFFTSTGIHQIKVILDEDSSEIFKINSETEILIKNVQMLSNIHLKYTPLAGLSEITEEINQIVNDIEKVKKKLNWKLIPCYNVLLNGPTGSGKTSIIQNFAIKNNCNVFSIKSSDIMKQYPGETESYLRNIFKNAQNFNEIFKPKDLIVILIEDIELICPNESTQNENDTGHQSRIAAQFLTLLDSLYSKNDNMIVLATTTKMDEIHTGLRRPGRFEKEISIPLLNEEQRKQIFQLLLKQSPFRELNFSDDFTNEIALKTRGYVGADLKLILQNVIQQLVVQKIKDFKCVEETEVAKLFHEIINKIKPTFIRNSDVSVYKTDMNFQSIGGMFKLKKILESSILGGLKNKAAFQKFGLKIPKGVLLYGPPGCAKTTIAKCLANEANMTFISTSGAELYSPYVGKAEKFIIKIFDTARNNAPCLIFLDEIDTLIGKRSLVGKDTVQTRILSILLTEMDGIGVNLNVKNDNNILVVAATNRPDMLDDALIRPGRFDKLIHVPAPDFESRLEIFKIYKTKMPFNSKVDLNYLAEKTDKFSGADICNLCNESALLAFTKNFNTEEISNEDFNFVLEKTKPSLSMDQIKFYYEFENKFKF